MKKLFSLSLLLTFFSMLSLAQENSLLWKISGNNLKTDSYILGTIHMMCPDDFIMHDKVTKVIGEVDKVVFEVNLFDEANTAQMQSMMMQPVPDFLKDLKESEIQLIDSVLKANQLSITMFDMFHPAMVMSVLSLKSFNCPDMMNIKSVEGEVYALAENKELGDLETLDFQMDMMSKIATPSYFYKYLQNFDEVTAMTQTMVQAYNQENLAELSKVINDPRWMSPEVYDIMLTKRNKNWVESIPATIAEGKTLIAVGAAHLIGDIGIIKLLQDKGYTVTPVLN